MKVKIEIKTDNAAFEDYTGSEVARILRELADNVDGESRITPQPLKDSNGNTVGKVEVD